MAVGPQVVKGRNANAPFTLKLYRGEGMVLAAMNWRRGQPPLDFVGFAIEYVIPGQQRFTPARSSKNFPGGDPNQPSTKAPFQRFRWVVFPYDGLPEGTYRFRVTPMFMDAQRKLSGGEPQEAELELLRETYPGALNVSFTRGFVLSQAFVNRFGHIETLIPDSSDDPLTFVPTHPEKDTALPWMGFEALRAMEHVLDVAIGDPQAKVSVIAYDLNLPSVAERLKQLDSRLRIIIDDSIDKDKNGNLTGHGLPDSPESQVAAELPSVKRQHLGKIQHNKTVVVESPTPENNLVLCGSTNFSWRGLFVQNNSAIVLQGEEVVKLYREAFDSYWSNAGGFRRSPSAEFVSLGLAGIDGKVAFSPHSAKNALLKTVAEDIKTAKSSVLYSLAFLFETTGAVTDAIEAVTNKPDVLVYGISDRRVKGIQVLDPDGNPLPVSPQELGAGLPAPFREEPQRTKEGAYMHHKFVVIDFDTADARVWVGSYNFSNPADVSNGENLMLFRDRRIATAYAIEALRIYDHYAFRASPKTAQLGAQPLRLPPAAGQDPWWKLWYADPAHKRDRLKFA